MGPYHRQALRAGERGDLVDIVDLFGIGLVGGVVLAQVGIDILQIDVDDRWLAAEAEARPTGVGLGLLVQLACSLVRLFHQPSPRVTWCCRLDCNCGAGRPSNCPPLC